ncbi:MAG: O-antigen ligase family protein, partial [Vicinamibacteria bacterium]
LTLLGLVGLYFILSRSRQTRDERARLLDAVLLSTIPLALYGLLQYVGLDPLPWLTDSVSPVLATMGRSNFLGAYMAMAVPLTFFRIASSSSRSPVRLWTILLLQASIVALSQARAAWLALVGGAVVFTALLDRGMERRRFLALTVSFLALGILLFTPLSGGDPPSLRVDGARSAPSFSEIRAHTVGSRLSIWRCTLSLLPDRWLLGYGPEAFARVFASRCPVAPPGWIVDDPHNLFLDQLFAAGVTGAIAFAILIVFFFRSLPAPDARNRNERALRAALLGSGTAFLVQAQFNPDAIALTLLFWVVLAIAARSREVTPRLRTRYNISNSTFE